MKESGKSAATGRPHYFGRRYPDDPEGCTWCGHPLNHPWHLDRPR